MVTTEQFLAAGETKEGKAYIQDVYFKECKAIIDEITGGAGLIMPISFRLREQKGGQQSTNAKLSSAEARFAPRPVAHLDRDPPTAVPVLEEAVGKEKAQELLSTYERWAQVNVWRPIGKPFRIFVIFDSPKSQCSSHHRSQGAQLLCGRFASSTTIASPSGIMTLMSAGYGQKMTRALPTVEKKVTTV